MKAIQVINPGNMVLVKKEMPTISDDKDVIIRVRATGICGSDVHIFHGTNPYATYPRILGHEVAGEVFKVGHGVSSLVKGDKVVLEPIQYCGKCYACKKGRPNVCSNLEVSGVHVDGGFQEYLKVKESMLVKFPDELSFIEAVTTEPYTIGAQANARAGTSEGDVVLIHGAGPIGLIVCDIAKSKGAICIVSEVNETRLDMAKDFGADYTINPMEENLKERILEITNGMGSNIIFDAAGVPKLLIDSIEMVSVAGTVVPMSFDVNPIPINFQQVNKKEITIVGTRLQSNKFPEMVRRLPERKDRIDKLITHIFPVEQFNEAFEVFTDKNSGACKVILTF